MGNLMANARIHLREILFWCLVSLLLAVCQVARIGGPRLSYDSYQYLNIAQHLASEGSAQTSIIHFDEERALERIPAPVSHFPIGYPTLIAALHLLGLPLKAVVLVISVLATVGCIPLLVMFSGLLAFSPGATRAALFLWVLNAHTVEFSVAALSEPLFTAMSLAAVVSIVKGEATSRTLDIVAGYILVGMAYWVRYSGILLIAAAGLYALVRCLQNRHRSAWLSGIAACAALAAAQSFRNLSTGGAWHGHTTKSVFHPIGEVAATMVRSLYHLLFGDGTVLPSAVILLLAAATIAVLASLLWGFNIPPRNAGSFALVSLYSLVYSVGMVFLGLFSVISFGTRMFIPLLPFLILLIVAWGSSLTVAGTGAPSRRLVIMSALVLGTGTYIFLNARSLASPLSLAPHEEVAQWLGQPLKDGTTMHDWMNQHLPSGQPIVVTEGQPLAYLTGRPVVSLVSSSFSAQVWDEFAVRSVMQRYKAQYLVAYTTASPTLYPVQADSVFLAGLCSAAAPSVPTWLELVADNGAVRAYYCRDCAQANSSSLQLTPNADRRCRFIQGTRLNRMDVD